METALNFHLNGRFVTIQNPAPSTVLIVYLHSAEVGLVGTREACGQGGCGAGTGALQHTSVNSCLRRSDH